MKQIEFAIDDSQTVIRITGYISNSDFPIPGIITIGSEQIKYTNTTDKEFVGCTRGYNSTSAIAHDAQSSVEFVGLAVEPTILDFSSDLIPSVDAAYSLGSASNRALDLYVSGRASIGERAFFGGDVNNYIGLVDATDFRIEAISGTSSIRMQPTDVSFVAGEGSSITLDGDNTSGNTRLLLWDVDSGMLQRVHVGANDSGGTGQRLLTIDNV